MIPLSKKKGQDIVKIEDIRPIIVRSHLSKIVERAILNKINEMGGHLLKTETYQSGFKMGKSTAKNLTIIIERIM